MDAQRFYQDDRFYPREIAITSHTLKQNILIDTCLISASMSLKDQKTNIFLSNNLLGFSMGIYDLDVKHNLTDDAEQMITLLYEKVQTTKRPFVAIKNYQLAKLLDICEIPYINIESYGCPNLELLNKRFGGKACHFHERSVPNRRNLRCAEQKCDNIWKWIIEYLKINS